MFKKEEGFDMSRDQQSETGGEKKRELTPQEIFVEEARARNPSFDYDILPDGRVRMSRQGREITVLLPEYFCGRGDLEPGDQNHGDH